MRASLPVEDQWFNNTITSRDVFKVLLWDHSWRQMDLLKLVNVVCILGGNELWWNKNTLNFKKLHLGFDLLGLGSLFLALFLNCPALFLAGSVIKASKCIALMNVIGIKSVLCCHATLKILSSSKYSRALLYLSKRIFGRW